MSDIFDEILEQRDKILKSRPDIYIIGTILFMIVGLILFTITMIVDSNELILAMTMVFCFYIGGSYYSGFHLANQRKLNLELVERLQALEKQVSSKTE
ncbi:hypothetical protein ACFL7D_01820 [candidate division KSB1 bacterium]